MILFLFCFFAAGHSGGPFGLAEAFLLFNLFNNEFGENALLLGMLTVQLLGIIAIRKGDAYNGLMLTVVSIFISVAVGAIVVSEADFVIWPNGLFIAVAMSYIIKTIHDIIIKQNPSHEMER